MRYEVLLLPDLRSSGFEEATVIADENQRDLEELRILDHGCHDPEILRYTEKSTDLATSRPIIQPESMDYEQGAWITRARMRACRFESSILGSRLAKASIVPPHHHKTNTSLSTLVNKHLFKLITVEEKMKAALVALALVGLALGANAVDTSTYIFDTAQVLIYPVKRS